MTEKQFVYWLRGYTENCSQDGPTKEEWQRIKGELWRTYSEDPPLPAYPSPIQVPCSPSPPWIITCTSNRTDTTNI